MSLDLGKPVRVAAVQMEGRVADIPFNLEQAEKLATEAFERQAKIVALPEFFTTPIDFDERLSGCALPPENQGLDMMRRLARRYAAYLGGSMLLRKGEDVFNTYFFVQPDGRAFTHDKDIPTMWENAFYVGGTDDGVMETDLGPVGAAVCWELIRTQTVRRMRGRIRLAMTGSNWWTSPTNWPGMGWLFGRAERFNRELAAETPVRFAKLLGVPVLHAGQAGAFLGRFLLIPGLDLSVGYASTFLGETKIVDREGRILSSRALDEGAGIAISDLLVEAGKPVEEPREESFWIPDLTAMHLAHWHHQNACGRRFYEKHKRRTGAAADPR
jgi:predicted amidohydrolase